MLEQIKVGAVSYLNTRPLLYGIRQSAILMQQIELIEDYPANIANMLMDGRIDIGLVPVAIIPKINNAQIISDFCIGAEGNVASVGLFSDVPVEEIEEVILDYQSRTSVNLARILLQQYWKLNPIFTPAGTDFIAQIKGTTAAIIIGDRALAHRNKTRYMYDLAGSWKAMTGLPFVFAAWVANKPLPDTFIEAFNSANALGMAEIDAVIKEINYPLYDVRTYFTQNISYRLTPEKLKGLDLFLEMLGKL
ncbi:hypothetical protein GD597_02500 [Panacibacter sp. KCS-6]|jgi:chorismate dehydratase|uniref:Chorismate dehydratase n=2 Tax=Limnovirga soli TaxID=2656915 RepID=A0A8J8FDE2_9BACT|nr:hypothetical protein [Limnovirga soli]